MNHRSILITGGAGFIGSHLTEKLLAEGHEVICLDDFNDFYDPRIKQKNIEPYLRNRRFHLIRGDIRNSVLVESTFQQWWPEAVVHLAARAGVRPSISQARLYESTNVTGTVNILEAAAKVGVKKIIFGSSSSVYGYNAKTPFAEGDPLLAAGSPYAATKIAGEALCSAYANIYRLPITILRFFTVYGPRQRPDLAIHRFFRQIRNREEITIFGDGSSARDYTYVDDIVQGISLALRHQGNLLDIYNLGNSQPVLLTDLIAAIEAVLQVKARIRRIADQPGDVPITFADISKAQEQLGYLPMTSMEEGLRLFADSMEGSA